MKRIAYSRRDFLRLSALTVFGVVTASCKQAAPTSVPVAEEKEAEPAPVKAEEPAAESVEAAAPKTEAIKEAPSVHAKVQAGELPPLDERLPKEPLVLIREGIEQEIGTYSDDKPFISASSASHHISEYFLMLNADCTKTIPNIGKAWETSEDGKPFTVYLREGMKWSDGHPFTADDIIFWYEDYVKNEELNPVFPTSWKVGGEPMEMVKIDDFTVEMRFAQPFYYMPYTINSNAFRGRQEGGAGGGFYLPAHFMKQFHIKHNPDADKLAQEQDYEYWYELFGYYAGALRIGCPALGPWVLTEEAATGNTYERNPYYFKVDPEGNQLPYISTMRSMAWEDNEGHLMLMVSGQIDYEAWGVSVGDWPVLKKNEEKGDFEVWMGGDCWVGYADFWLNETFDADPEMGEILANPKFRQALSLAIDRDEIVEKIGLGNGIPMQATVWRDCSFYKEEWGTAYAELDIDRANALLDEIGLDKRDEEGFRLKPSGDKLTLIIECTTAIPYWVPISELTKSYWEAVGVRTILQVQEWNTLWTRLGANEMHIFTWVVDNKHEFVLLAGNSGFQQMSWWGLKWWQWLTTDGAEGIEPSDDVKRLYELCSAIPSTPPDQIAAVMQEIWDDQAKNIRAIGTIGYVGKPIYTKKKLGNVDKKAYADNADIGGTRNNWCEMWFWKA